jgi:hypothetical protein
MDDKVFISYSSVDAKQAKRFAKALDEIQIAYFLDSKDIKWGDSITERVSQALANCYALIVIVSPASLKSQWVPFEIGQAKAFGKIIMPFLTHPSLDLPDYLQNCHYVTRFTDAKAYLKSAFAMPSHDKETRKMLAGRKISETMTMMFVDLMRLLYVSTSDIAYKANVENYSKFTDLARLHLDNIKSHVSTFSASLDAELVEQSCDLERQLSYMLNELKSAPDLTLKNTVYFAQMRGIGEELHEFCLAALGKHYKQDADLVASKIEKALNQKETLSERPSLNEIFVLRLKIQSELLLKDSNIGSIKDDIKQRSGILYFVLDYLLLVTSLAKTSFNWSAK